MYIKIYATDKATKQDFEDLCYVGHDKPEKPVFFHFADETAIDSKHYAFVVNAYEEVTPC